MAIIRCRVHAPHGGTQDDVAAVKPVGFPEAAWVWGSKQVSG
jgi:hypothetical protein